MRRKITKGLLCFIPTIIGSITWNNLPNEMPTHFGLFGTADRFSSKFSVVFIEPTVFFIIHIIAIVVIEKHPDWLGYHHSKTWFNYFIPILSFVTFFISAINSLN